MPIPPQGTGRPGNVAVFRNQQRVDGQQAKAGGARAAGAGAEGAPVQTQDTGPTVQPWVTGPNYIFFGLPEQTEQAAGTPGGKPTITTSQKWLYFGTASYCPKPTIQRAWRPILSSFRGIMQPSERGYMGCEARIDMVMSRWDEKVYEAVRGDSSDYRGVVGGGAVDPDDIGSLLRAQNKYVGVAILFPNQGYPIYRYQPKGYKFHYCSLENELLLEEGGTEGRMLGLSFHASSEYDGRAWNLYSWGFNDPKMPTKDGKG